MFHDAERFSDRENLLIDYHPAFHVDPDDSDEADDEDESASAPEPSTSVASAVEDAIALLALLGWEPGVARAGVEYVASRLAESSSRASAFEMLRRDRHARALLDLPGASWTTLLRALLGAPDPALAHTNTGRGVLLRLLIGQPLRALLLDDELVAAVSLVAPRRHGGGEGR